jgi:DNA end-binding protein Ku
VDAVQQLVKRKIAAGDTQVVTAIEASPEKAATSNVVDLTELLARSLKQRQGSSGAREDQKKSPRLTSRPRRA